MRESSKCRSLLKQCIRKRCNNNEGSLLWLGSTLLLSCFLLSSLPIASAARPSLPSSLPLVPLVPLVQSSLSKDLRDWIHARCGCGTTADDTSSNDAPAIWVYEGALFDPLQGKKIATVQGVELVRCVATMDHGSTSPSTSTFSSSKQRQQQDYQAKCGDLECAPLLTHPNATFEYAATLLSRKLFCYTTTGPSFSSADRPQQPQQLLTTIKLNPNAPRRKIPLRQTIVGYDTATTFIARNSNTNSNSNDANQEELIAHTEWPDRQTIWGRATRNWIHQNEDDNHDNSDNPQRQPQPSSKTFDFTIYARQKSARKKPDQLFDLTTTTTTSNQNKNNNHNATIVASPRRAKWIEFGTSSSNGKDKFGARETYTYTYTCPNNIRGSTTTTNPQLTSTPTKGLFHPFGFPKQQPQRATATTTVGRVRYSRYGEGPPFVGPGRICSLELQGRRVNSLDEIPPVVAAVMAERVSPPFVAPATTTTTTTNTGANNNNKMMEWFRSQSPMLPLCPASGDDNSSLEEDFWLPDYLRQRGMGLWHKLKGRPTTKRDDGTSTS